ncbi:DDE-domain-containing protein [Ascobolus immersus RN42]|uniref:DDE-domain-containing protein n=1 Tax=Ascobolus immersus RN42 TaxID=1160509 RepID=A0A3N4IIX0_ASCIM|nr:DDE-domain-containing protein [Ascobolus immersus RN42]
MKTAAQGGSDHRLLLWDSHTSHTTLDVRYFGVNNLIHLCTFPSHQTHKLQPLDVAIFSPLALAYKILLEKWNRKNPYAAMGKAEFFLLLSRAREIALTEENIRSAFAATGMYSPKNIVLC